MPMAGLGSRFEGGVPKPFVPVLGEPMFRAALARLPSRGRATLVVREHSTAAFGVRSVQAVLQLDPEEEAWLQDRVGETLAFVGRIVHCDPYLRNLVIAEAKIR